MKKEDVYKKVDSMVKRLEKTAGEYGEGCFPMKKEVSFSDWKGQRLYIKLVLTDRFGTRRKYECGYIDLSTGKYSSKCKSRYGALSLFHPNYDLLKFDFRMTPPPDEVVNEWKRKMMKWGTEEEEDNAKKEGRKPRKVIDFVDGKFEYGEE